MAIEATLDAENEFTTDQDDVTQNASGDAGIRVRGLVSLSIANTFVGTLTLQRSLDKGVTWWDVNTFDGDDVGTFSDTEPEDALWRIGFKTGDYTSGDADVRIGG